MLNRTEAMTTVLQHFEQALIVTGLGNIANDVAKITQEHPRAFSMDGAMGAAVSVGLGVALARPNQKVLVATGDGELLMNVGTLATVAMKNPSNLAIVVIDNGSYGLTGGQNTATATVADLEIMARGAGIQATWKAHTQSELEKAVAELAETPGLGLLVVKVAEGPGAEIRIERDGTVLRDRFRNWILGLEKGAR